MKTHLTEEDIFEVIITANYEQIGKKTVVCCLTLANGFEVIGSAAAVSPEKFNWGVGKKIAARKAMEKVWELEGYLLQEKLTNQ